MLSKTDIVIVGCGVAGLFCALHLPQDKNIQIITKSDKQSSDSFLAQGGICVLRDDNDFDSFYEDTMKAGHYENRPESVKTMIAESRGVIDDLVSFGVEFTTKNGEFVYTKEGAHSRPRILYYEDITGAQITSKLLAEVEKRENITLSEYTGMTDLLVQNDVCIGIQTDKGAIYADTVVLATGGIGGNYPHSTNYPHLTGDAITVAKKHGVRLQHLDYVQFHPTTLYSQKVGRRFLISESVRGEGAVLLNAAGERFTDELQPRDVVTAAIRKQMEQDGTDYVWLSLHRIPKEEILRHFPHIYEHCLEEGYDITKEPIPVVPAQHYFMGGVWVDIDAKTTMPHLYAVGETACNGVHGKNRLASNSLLESLVFAKRAAKSISKTRKGAVTMNTITMTAQADKLIRLALEEDISSEDVTTNSVMPTYVAGEVELIAKQDGIIAGLPVYKRVFELLDKDTKVELYCEDGETVQNGQLLGKVKGDIRVLLSGERVALNYLQRMSGIATYTNEVTALLKESKVKLLDTRKTTPNMRLFEKYAVKVGGGHNHRYNLSDGVLLKDNHIAAAGSIANAVQMARAYAPFVRKIEVEVETLDMVKEAVAAGADIIMLDNMTAEQMRQAVAFIDGRAETECSGNVTKENIAKYIEIGVDYISSGALTHSAPILDISMKNLHAIGGE